MHAAIRQNSRCRPIKQLLGRTSIGVTDETLVDLPHVSYLLHSCGVHVSAP